MRDDADMDRRGAVRTMLGLGALPLVGACARAARVRLALTPRALRHATLAAELFEAPRALELGIVDEVVGAERL